MKNIDIDMGYAYTSEGQIEKDLEVLSITVKAKEKIKNTLITFYKEIIVAENMLQDNQKDKFVKSLLNQLSYDLGEGVFPFVLGQYEDYTEYVEQLRGYKAKELVEAARKEYDDYEGELEKYSDEEFSYRASEWVDLLY